MNLWALCVTQGFKLAGGANRLIAFKPSELMAIVDIFLSFPKPNDTNKPSHCFAPVHAFCTKGGATKLVCWHKPAWFFIH